MIDQLRDQIKHRLEDLAAETDRLRTALGALNGGAPSATPASARRASTSRRPRAGVPKRETQAAKPARARRTASASARSPRRTASGSTRAAVLAALASGEALTAGQVAEKARLGRGTVSTTLSKLSKSGEVQKAARGYQLPKS